MDGKNGTSPEEVVLGLWKDVIQTVNKILDANKKFGFTSIAQNIVPSLEDIIHGFGIVDSILGALVTSELLGHDSNRQALNAKQCVVHIRVMAAALKDNDKGEYDKAVALLGAQSKFYG